MNERYLYRGKTKPDGEWIYGGHMYVESLDMHIIVEHDGCNRFSDECFGFSAVIPETVGQCTGLKDKNGNWIFEGDIFKFDDEVWSSCYTSCGTEYDSYDVVNYGAIGFNKDSASYDFIKYKYNENSIEADLHENCSIEFADFVTELEVIGNKWDNPELLEVE